MIDFELILQGLVGEMDKVTINGNSMPVQFYWGRGKDLNQYLTVMRESATPLVWSVPARDEETEIDGVYTREARINICHVETRKGLLNTNRMDPSASFLSVLYPIWEGLKRRIDLSDQMSIKERTLTFQKYPNFATNQDEHDVLAVWDVLQLEFTAEINEAYNC